MQNVSAQQGVTGQSREMRGIALAFLGAACWGFSGTCVSYLVGHNQIAVSWLACARLLVAGALFLAVALVRDPRKVKCLFADCRNMKALVAYAAIGVVMLQIGYMSAIKYTNAGTALLLQEVCIPLVLVYACLRDRRAPKPIECVAVALAAFGVTSIATQGNVGSLGINPLGLAWGFVTAFAMAGYNVIPVRLIRSCGSFATNGCAMLMAGAALAPFARPWEMPPAMDGAGWAVFAAIVLVGTMFAYGVYLKGVDEAGPVRASLVGVFEPVSGAVFSALWLGTSFTGWDYLGGAFIISMMVLVALKA